MNMPFTVLGFTWYEFDEWSYPWLRVNRRYATRYGATQAGLAAGFKKAKLQVIDLRGAL